MEANAAAAGSANEAADGANVPADGANVPSDGANVPAEGANVPADDADVAADGANVAAGSTKEAADDANVAAGGANVANIIWLSLDPVRGQLDFYPRVIAEQIEAAYSSAAEQCVLGADFFNATVHFQNGTAFQTTPGQHFGRGGHKQPGYRTVRRVVKEEDTTTIPGKRIHGEWRMCEPGAPEAETERTFVSRIPEECLVAAGTGAAPPAASIRVWTAEDLASSAPEPGSAEPSLVIWQWCRGSQGDSSLVNGADSILLGDEMWSPYLEETSLALAPSPNPTPNP